MKKQKESTTRSIFIILAILLVWSVAPVVYAEGNDDYLDGGYMGMPAWLYYRIDPSLMSKIIGSIHHNFLFGPIGQYHAQPDDHFVWQKPSLPQPIHRLF